MTPLPDEVLAADAALHRIHGQIRPTAHLNPLNVVEARAAFFRGAEAPPFRYAPTEWADDALDALGRIAFPRAHPLGHEVAESAADTAALVVALRDRTAEAFDGASERGGWLLAVEDAPVRLPRKSLGAGGCPPPFHVGRTPPGSNAPSHPAPRAVPPTSPDPLARIPHALFRRTLAQALADATGGTWRLVDDPVMSARVLVDAVRREVLLAPHAQFRARDLAALVAHEIDVHVRRAEGGRLQSLQLFETGLHRSLVAEEGLALLAEHVVSGLPEGFEGRHAEVRRAAHRAREVGFRALWETLAPTFGQEGAFNVALRLKRGLADPGAPGVYAKDTVYGIGYRAVRDWYAGGGDLGRLYVGKVGLHHPVEDWIAAGWVRAPDPPPGWVRALAES